MTESIKLIVVSPPAPTGERDRLGGQTHGVVSHALAKAAEIDVPTERFASQLQSVIGMVQGVSDRLKDRVGSYSAEEITIGLAISGEGSIGVATAGVEASIEVTLKRRS
jgi:hypothetical protein